MAANQTKLKVLGEGAFGRVCPHFSKKHNQSVARKLLYKRKHFDLELKFYNLCKGQFNRQYSNCIVQLLSSSCHPKYDKFFLDFEMAETSYHELAFDADGDGTRCPQLTNAESVRTMVIDAIHGMVFLHREVKLIHNDLKPANLLRFKNGATKICDLGICSMMEEARNFGTFGFTAPELYDDVVYVDEEAEVKVKSDVFSLGVTLFQILEGRHPTELTKDLEGFYNAWNDERNPARRTQLFNQFKKAGKEFYTDDFRAAAPAGLNVASVGYAVSHLIVDMCAVDTKQRPTSAHLTARLRLLGEIEKVLASNLLPKTVTTVPSVAQSMFGTRTAANAIDVHVGAATVAERAATITSPSSPKNLHEFAMPQPPQPIPSQLPQLEPSLSTPLLLVSNQGDVLPQQVVVPLQQEQILISNNTAVPATNHAVLLAAPAAAATDILMKAIAIAIPQQFTPPPPELPPSEPQIESPVRAEDVARLKSFVKSIVKVLRYGKNKSVYVNQLMSENQTVVRRLRKRGVQDSITPFTKELLKMLFDDTELASMRKQVFCKLTGRSANWWKKSGLIQEIRDSASSSSTAGSDKGIEDGMEEDANDNMF